MKTSGRPWLRSESAACQLFPCRSPMNSLAQTSFPIVLLLSSPGEGKRGIWSGSRLRLDLVPEIGALGRVFDEIEPHELVVGAGAAALDDSVAEAGSLRELLADLLLEQVVDPRLGKLGIADGTRHRPGVKPGKGSFLGIDIGDVGACILHRLHLLLAVIGPDQRHV